MIKKIIKQHVCSKKLRFAQSAGYSRHKTTDSGRLRPPAGPDTSPTPRGWRLRSRGSERVEFADRISRFCDGKCGVYLIQNQRILNLGVKMLKIPEMMMSDLFEPSGASNRLG